MKMKTVTVGPPQKLQ